MHKHRDPHPPHAEEPDETDGEDDGSYAEEHVEGRQWVEFATTSNSRTYAMEISGELQEGCLVRTTSWGDDGEFAIALIFVPKVGLDVLRNEP